MRTVSAAVVFLPLFLASFASADPLVVHRATARIDIDGDLSDAAWNDAARVETFYETQPGDNVAPRVKTTGWITYDDRFFYVAMEMEDPNIVQLRAPYTDRDNLPESTDYAGILLDTRNDGTTAMVLLSSARGVQFDSVVNDATGGESVSPDFHWDVRTRLGTSAWTMEMRIPLSSLRYSGSGPQTWRILFHRNYPRERLYKFFSATFPRGTTCTVCRTQTLTGIDALSSGSHSVIAPYVTASRTYEPSQESSALAGRTHADVGADFKWTPSPGLAVDLTANPDFSQVESDEAAITANERFAINYPEKRPFFLEGSDLLSMPIEAVYTRTITAPRWGARVTGQWRGNAYTLLVAQDEGGGSVIIPAANSSNLAVQDFGSLDAVFRARRNIGPAVVGFLGSARANDGGSYNRVAGPDVQWRPNDHYNVIGQLLFSDTRTPDRPELAAEWDGRKLRSYNGHLSHFYSNGRFDWFTQYRDAGEDFRADLGFVPQVGFRNPYNEFGYAIYPKGFFSKLRGYFVTTYSSRTDGALLSRRIVPGLEGEGRWSSYFRARMTFDRVRAGEQNFPRTQYLFTARFSPPRFVSDVTLDTALGDELDFANQRVGRITSIVSSVSSRPTDHWVLALTSSYRTLRVDGGRLFTAHVERLKSTYAFDARSFLRVIVQNVQTERNEALYTFPVARRTGGMSVSALYGYRLNWQTVLFAGYGDDRELDETGDLEETGRRFLVKLSYAFQR